MTTLFGYTVEERDGSLVITVQGQLAERALDQLREGLDAGGTLPLLRLLSPLAPIGQLLSAPVRLSGHAEPGDASPPAAIPGQEQTSQELDQTFEAFRQQVAQMRAAVDELKAAEPVSGPRR
jgi:hypothetical protein